MSDTTYNKEIFRLVPETLQCAVLRYNPFYMYFFGPAQYERNKPVLTESIRAQAQPIVDQLNSGELTITEAEKLLDKIWI